MVLKANYQRQSIIILVATYPALIKQLLPQVIATLIHHPMGSLHPTLIGHPPHTEICMG